MQNTQIKLDEKESADFARLSDKLDGFLTGARALADYMKRAKVEEIISERSRKPQGESGTENETGDSI